MFADYKNRRISPAGAFAGRHVLITGATGGIGSALSAEFAKEGCKISAVARREDRLFDLAEWVRELGGKCNIIAKNLACEKSYPEIIGSAEKVFGAVEVAFFTAGILPFGRVFNCETDEIAEAIKVNLVSPIALTSLILPNMIRNEYGRICAISSLAARLPIPRMSVYSASKAGLSAFCETASDELRGTGVSLTCVEPRGVATSMINFLHDSYVRMGWQIDPAKEVAYKILRATALGKQSVALGNLEKLFIEFASLFPTIRKPILRKAEKVFSRMDSSN